MKIDSVVFRDIIRSNSGLLINKLLIRALGPEMAVFLSDLCDRDHYFHSHNKNYDGWFFAKKESRSFDLCLSEKSLQRLMKRCTEENFVEMSMKGQPALQWIKINYDEIYNVIQEQSNISFPGYSSLPRTGYTRPDETGYSIIDNNTRSNNTKKTPLYPPLENLEPKKEKPDKYFIKQLPTPYQQDKEFITVWKEYIDDRKKTTLHAVTRIINDMRRSCRSDIAFATRCIEKSIRKCWTDIYFKKDEYQKQERQWPKSEDGMHHTDPQEYADIHVEVIYNDWEARKEQKDEQKIERPKRRGSSLRV